MKQIEVVAAIIRHGDRFLATQRAMVSLKMAGNFPVVKLKRAKNQKKP